MQRTAILNRPIAVTEAPWRAWLRKFGEALRMDADERFLRGAQDLADLERRLRQLERGHAERFRPLARDA
jgi:hypothetical protein